MGDEIVDRCHRCSLDRDPFGLGVVSLPTQGLGQEAADGRAETLLADAAEGLVALARDGFGRGGIVRRELDLRFNHRGAVCT